MSIVLSSYNLYPQIVTDGLILNLDAGNPQSYSGIGTTWFDLSGNGNNGTLLNGVEYNSTNRGSLVFDGINDFVTGSIPTINAWSMCVWCFSLDITTRGIFYPFSGTDSSSTGIFFGGILGNELVRNRWGFFDGTYIMSSFNTSILTNTWYYLVVTKNGSIYNLYTDGRFSLTFLGGNISLTTYKLGVRGDNNWYFKGNIAQASIYNKALTELEIKQNFNALRGRFEI